MNNENNVNATQNPNVTNTNVNPSVPNQTVNSVETPVAVAETVAATPSAPATTEVKPATNNLETIVVPSDFPEETPAQAATNVNMPTVVNPLEVKVEAKPEVAPEVKPVVANPEEQQVTELKISEYQEKLRKAQENYKPPSKFQMNFTIFMFICCSIPDTSSKYTQISVQHRIHILISDQTYLIFNRLCYLDTTKSKQYCF